MKLFVASVLIALAIMVATVGCTANQRARQWGGTITVVLPANKKLVNATWKGDNSLWYLLRDRTANEPPITTEFVEDSSFGFLEGKVIFKEK